MLLAIEVIIALFVLGVIYCFVHNKRLVVTRYNLAFEKLPKAFSGKRILQISDLHTKTYGRNYDRLIKRAKLTNPDYIFFTGDLYSRAETKLDNKVILMKRLKEIAPVYYVTGNHELDYPEKTEKLVAQLETIGINVLRNRKIQLFVGDEHVNLYGAEFSIHHYKNPEEENYKQLSRATVDDLDRMFGAPEKNEFNILLAHSPFPFEVYAKWGADLTFAGHCHGGLIRLPFVGGILSPERKFFPKYTKGIYEYEKDAKIKMVVSAGLGKFRVNNPAELVLVTLS